MTVEPAQDPMGAVTVAYLHSNEVAYSWHQSLIDLIGHDLANHGRIIRGGWMSMKVGTGGIVEGRNKAVRGFLAEKDAEWLWWVDTDMGFAPDTVDQLIGVADPQDRPVVGALCFAHSEIAPDGMGGYQCEPRPTIFDWVGQDGEGPADPDGAGIVGFRGRTTYPVHALVRCDGTGSACILIHRSVFEQIAERFGPVWYNRIPKPSGGADEWISEDLSFCMRVGAVGLSLHVHTGVRTTHAKTTWVAEEDYWQLAVAPPATQETAVIVPVLRRPGNAAPFMASLRASTGLATAYALCSPDDTETIDAWHKVGAEVLRGDDEWVDNTEDQMVARTFAEKANLGYRQTREPWLLLVGDDVRFHPGWLDHAQATAGDRYHVIGTNDLGNPRVTSGEHATHLLIRRSYVDEVGGGWDGPGVVAHEGYRHWFCDDEIVTAAKQRGAWAMSLASKVEHLHPLLGKADMDPVYELGQVSAHADKQRFLERLTANTGGAAA